MQKEDFCFFFLGYMSAQSLQNEEKEADHDHLHLTKLKNTLDRHTVVKGYKGQMYGLWNPIPELQRSSLTGP